MDFVAIWIKPLKVDPSFRLPPSSPAMQRFPEKAVRGDLIRSSSGGDIYSVPGEPTLVCKQVHSPKEMMNVCSLSNHWAKMTGTDWVVPKALMTRASILQPTGYIMRKASGVTLHSLETTFHKRTFPLIDVIGRVALGMAQAIQQHIFPMVEHSGNVMVDIYPHSLEVSLIDADACHRWEEDHTEMDVLVQLEIIFGNFEAHLCFKSVFDSAGRIRATSLARCIETCRGSSASFFAFVDNIDCLPRTIGYLGIGRETDDSDCEITAVSVVNNPKRRRRQLTLERSMSSHREQANESIGLEVKSISAWRRLLRMRPIEVQYIVQEVSQSASLGGKLQKTGSA